MNHPLRLSTGSHQAGSGQGCAMNVISWENGDTTITDYPACSDRLLARLVQKVNDTLCTHRQRDLLCADCSVKVLALAHRTVGTALTGWANEDVKRIYVRLALHAARSVEHLGPREARECNDTVAAWLEGKATRAEVIAKCRAAADADADAYAADADAYAADAYVAYAYAADAYAAYAADAYVADAYAAADAADAADAYAAYAAAAVADAAYAAYAAVAVADAAKHRFTLTSELIDLFLELTETQPVPADETATQAALEKMLVRR